MRMKNLRRRLPQLIVILTATVIIAGVCMALTKPADTGVPPPLRFTSVSYAKDQEEAPAAKTDLSKCIIT